jgi:hypothetical protein
VPWGVKSIMLMALAHLGLANCDNAVNRSGVMRYDPPATMHTVWGRRWFFIFTYFIGPSFFLVVAAYSVRPSGTAKEAKEAKYSRWRKKPALPVGFFRRLDDRLVHGGHVEKRK